MNTQNLPETPQAPIRPPHSARKEIPTLFLCRSKSELWGRDEREPEGIAGGVVG